MDLARKRTKWSLAFFFGWLLSFPMHGPALESLAVQYSLDAPGLGLSFILAHALGLLMFGLFFPKDWLAKLLKIGPLTVGALSLMTILLAPLPFWPGLFIVLSGLVAAAYIIAWSHPYISCGRGEWIGFMAGVIFGANLILYVIRLAAQVLPASIIPLLTIVPLVGSYWLGRGLCENITEIINETQTQKSGLPFWTLALFYAMVVGLYINGGLLYSSIWPFFSGHIPGFPIFQDIPYLVALIFLIYWGNRFTKRALVYTAVSVMGIGFVSLAFLGPSLPGYFLTESFVLSGLALLDVFLWASLGKIAYLYGNGAQIFGVGLSINLVALGLGSTLAFQVVGPGQYIATGLAAAGLIFITILIIPSLLTRMSKDLSQGTDWKRIEDELGGIVPNYDSLTEREKEIVRLIIEGQNNTGIAGELFISENTVKAHIKNVNRKLGVANKYELLAKIIKHYTSARRSARSISQ